MDFFQKIGATLSNTGKDIAEKTKKLSDTSKLNSEISKQQNTINQTYTQIGKIYFEKYSNLDCSELKELCDSITAANAKIEELQKEITQIKGLTNCPKCNAEISTSATFCGNCGYKLKEETTPVETTTENTDANNE